MKPSQAVVLVLCCSREGRPPLLTHLERAAPHYNRCHPQPGMCQVLAKDKPTPASLLKSCCLCAHSQLQTAAVHPGLIFLLFCRVKSSLSGHTRRSSHPPALTQGVRQGRVRVCARCVSLPAAQTSSVRTAASRVTSACSGVFPKPVRGVTERFWVPLRLTERKSAAGLGLGKPLMCVVARCGWVGLMDTPHCRATLGPFPH